MAELKEDKSAEIRFSRLSVVAFVFAILSVIPWFVPVAIVVGIASLIRIEASGGRLGGRRMATSSVVITALILFAEVSVPTLSFRNSSAYRMTCGTNLAGIGKAMMMYANEYDGLLPRSGGRVNAWTSHLSRWQATERSKAFAIDSRGDGQVTISSNLYLLVKYAEVTPKQFICMQQTQVTEFSFGHCQMGDPNTTLTDVWDFGPEPWKHINYSYNWPFNSNRLMVSEDAGTAIMADTSPWFDSLDYTAAAFHWFVPDEAPWTGTPTQSRHGNSARHLSEGQNVLFMDLHVSLERHAYCAVDRDNIYTVQDGNDVMRGLLPDLRSGRGPVNPGDSVLVHDPALAR